MQNSQMLKCKFCKFYISFIKRKIFPFYIHKFKKKILLKNINSREICMLKHENSLMIKKFLIERNFMHIMYAG